MKKLLYICVLLSIFTACESDDEALTTDNAANFGYHYFPLQLNQEHIFQVDSIIYDDFTGTVDTFKHQRREYVEQKYVDTEGRLGYIIGVYERLDDTAQWIQKGVIQRLRTNIRLEELNNNLISIPMVFPVSGGKEWNTNLLNTEDEQQYKYTNVHLPILVDTTLYDSTLIILQRDQQNLVEQFVSTEIYAAGVGMINRTDKELRISIRDGTIESGYKATLSLISFQEGN